MVQRRSGIIYKEWFNFSANSGGKFAPAELKTGRILREKRIKAASPRFPHIDQTVLLVKEGTIRPRRMTTQSALILPPFSMDGA
jgi:hypothetical protein